MNLLQWSGKKCVAVPEEFWREDKAKIFAYINANPEKIYLLPDTQGTFDEEISIHFACEIKFPCAAKLISATGEFTVETLDALEHISYNENFMPTRKSFLVVPEDFSNVANEIKRQCSILQVPLEICAEEKFSTLAVKQKLIDNAEKILGELDDIKTLRDRKAELHLPENISLLEEFLTAAEALEEYLQSSSAPIKLIVTGEQKELLAETFCEILDELTASEEFCAEKLIALYQGKISAELKNMIVAIEDRLQSEYDEQLRKLIALTKNIIDKHRTQAQSFIDFVYTTTGNFSTAPRPDIKLPELKSFDLPPFDAGLSENFSSDNLSELVKHCTRIICMQEAQNDWNFYKANREQLIKRFYLAGTFRRELRRRLDKTFRNETDALEKKLRQKLFAATLEYFAQVSEICRTQREFTLNIFRKHTEEIYNQIEFLNQDFVAMGEMSRAGKNFYETWRLIYPEQSQQVPNNENSPDNLLAEMLERKNRLINLPLNNDAQNDLLAERFLPAEIKSLHNSATSNADFTAGKAAFNNKKYENAFKNFSRAAATGNVEAIKYLAFMNQNGFGTPQNIYAAIENYLDAFNLGDNESISELGEIFLNLNCSSRALEWYQTAVDRKDKYSLEILQQ